MTQADESASARTSSGPPRPVSIEVRRMGLAYPESTPEFWFDGDPLLTMFFAAFSATLPEGEKQFIQSVRNFQARIEDPVLLAEIRAFVGQEAQHAKEHHALNAFMKSRGLSIGAIEEATVAMTEFMKRQSEAQQLANTVCAEHLTAIWADYFMRQSPEMIEKIDARVRTLWAWHVIEEAEHKAVAFDVYQQAVGDEARLHRTMRMTVVLFIFFNALNTITLLREAGQLGNVRSWIHGMRVLIGKGGMLPSMRRPYLDFYRPGFHPWQHDNREALAAWRARYLPKAA